RAAEEIEQNDGHGRRVLRRLGGGSSGAREQCQRPGPQQVAASHAVAERGGVAKNPQHRVGLGTTASVPCPAADAYRFYSGCPLGCSNDLWGGAIIIDDSWVAPA